MTKKMTTSLKKEYEQSQPQTLEPELWELLENTDSKNITTGKFEKVQKTSLHAKRDWENIYRGFQQGKEMETPLIAKLPDNRLYLISGNTRLCTAKASGITPRVIIISFPEKDFKKVL